MGGGPWTMVVLAELHPLRGPREVPVILPKMAAWKKKKCCIYRRTLILSSSDLWLRLLSTCTTSRTPYFLWLERAFKGSKWHVSCHYEKTNKTKQTNKQTNEQQQRRWLFPGHCSRKIFQGFSLTVRTPQRHREWDDIKKKSYYSKRLWYGIGRFTKPDGGGKERGIQTEEGRGKCGRGCCMGSLIYHKFMTPI